MTTNMSAEKIKDTDEICPKCKGTGKYFDEVFGIEVDCDCQYAKEAASKKKEEVEKTIKILSEGDKQCMVYTGLIPDSRKNDDYKTEYFKANVTNEYGARKLIVRNSQQYVETLESLCGSAIAGERLGMSYFINSPNGFSKTTVANTCIKYMASNGMKCVPFISLARIGEMCDLYEVSKKVKFDKILQYYRNKLDRISKNGTESEIEKVYNEYESTGKAFTWNDVATCDVLYTYFSDFGMSSEECCIAMKVLGERALLNLPTVIMSNSILSAVNKENIAVGTFIRDYLSYSDNNLMTSMDKLKQITCYVTSK